VGRSELSTSHTHHNRPRPFRCSLRVRVSRLPQAGAALQPYGEVLSTALTRAINNVSTAVIASCGTNSSNAAAGTAAGGSGPHHHHHHQQQQQQRLLGAPGQQQQRPGGGLLASEVTQEGLAAAALVDVMLQVCVCVGVCVCVCVCGVCVRCVCVHSAVGWGCF
jgi:hypothetical protein